MEAMIERGGQVVANADQGLYRGQYEHDACGVGFVADLKNRKSHEIIERALRILRNLEHRGATGCDARTGDGAGILMQVPHKFFKKSCAEIGIDLPEAEKYGIGVVFLPRKLDEANFCEQAFERVIMREGQRFLGWRDVPVDNAQLGETARACEPFIRQVFIGAGRGARSSG